MSHDKIIKATEKFVKEQLINEATGHDWWHAHRVRNNAKLINKTEKADWFVIELACLLHDVGDRKVIKKSEDDFSLVKKFLLSQKIRNDVLNKVMFIIENMSFSKSLSGKKIEKNIELFIVQDADRLDAIGAIGIARTFAYGGSANQILYDPGIQPRINMTPQEYKTNKTTTFNHFEEKLFLLKDLLNTKTAKEIAQDRHIFMKEYLNRFLEEWNGQK